MAAKNSEKKVRGKWTNEKHINFLNSMEASFVHTMLQHQNDAPPLHRYLPDTSDSTQDPPPRTFLSEWSGRRTEKKSRNIGSQKSSQDQVVPQFPNNRVDKDKDDGDHFNFSIGPAN